MPSQPDQTIESQINRLEQQFEVLEGQCKQLVSENRSLRERQEQLVAERAVLIEKNELARNRVEAMIGRLKAMEQGS
jgi:cell division protein ZapB